MKIKDIINEAPGFFSGYAKGLLPKTMSDVISAPIRGTGQLSNAAADRLAQKMFFKKGDPVPAKEPGQEPQQTQQTKPQIEVPPTSRARPKAEKSAEPAAAEEEPYSLSTEELPRDERIAVNTPAGMMYKYPNGRWYSVPTTGIPTPVPTSHFATLDSYANKDGYVEKIPPQPKPRKK